MVVNHHKLGHIHRTELKLLFKLSKHAGTVSCQLVVEIVLHHPVHYLQGPDTSGVAVRKHLAFLGDERGDIAHATGGTLELLCGSCPPRMHHDIGCHVAKRRAAVT